MPERRSEGMVSRRKVAVILQLWQNFDRGILEGISGYMRENRGWSVFVEEVEHQRIPDFSTWDGDGLIVNFDNRQVAEAVRGIDKPVVGVGGGAGWHDPASGIPYVATDDDAIGRLAAEHLLECGFRSFAFCGYPKTRTNLWMSQRERGFVEALRDAGHACMVFHGRHATAVRWQEVQGELCRWLRKLPRPVGIMGCYDYRARHLLEACRTLGLSVPDEVAVVGVDNDVVCELADPPLTSIEQGRFGIGYTAASILNRMMSGQGGVPAREVIPPLGLFRRQSTDILCVEDEVLASALRMIRLEACSGLQAPVVAGRVGLSRNTLDKRFQQRIGRSIDQEIRRVRMERAKELLARTNLPLAEIAGRAGFGSEQYLSSAFRQAVGCRPSEYRARHRDTRSGQP